MTFYDDQWLPLPIQQHPLEDLTSTESRSKRSRLKRFCEWQHTVGDKWYLPDLVAWRDHLLHTEQQSATTARAYLSTIRSAYRQLLRSNHFRQRLYEALPGEMSQERKLAYITEMLTRLKNALDPDNAVVTTLTIQDEADEVRIWLTPTQVAALIAAPGLETMKGLRDTALMALLLCTGIRAAEAVALDVSDLRTSLGGELALRVRAGKGFKQRLVPYGAQDWGLTLTEAWLKAARITEGAVFTGLRKGDHLFTNALGQPERLAVNRVGIILREYPMVIQGHLATLKPHDLRRTYARRLYLIGTDLTAIQQNLGHDSQQTTLAYIGTLDAHERAPEDAYGTVWLQPLWEKLAAQQQPARALVNKPIQENTAIISKPKTHGYQFKIMLQGIRPLIWRRFQVPGTISFQMLHQIIQVVMGWEDYHLYQFLVNGYSFRTQLQGWGERSASELIADYLQAAGSSLGYEYDFGDQWEHELVLEKVLPSCQTQPICLAGRLACPPEDCGGVWGYHAYLKARKHPRSHAYREWRERIGSYFDPTHFDIEEVNQNLISLWQAFEKRSLEE